MRSNVMALVCSLSGFPTRWIVRTTTLLIVLTLASAVPTSADNFITSEMLQETLRSQDIDKIRNVFDSVRSMQYKGEVLPVLHDVWRNKKEKYPKLEWVTLNKPIIRAEIANILSQGWRNGAIRLDAMELHTATTSMLDSEDVAVVLIALQTLEAFDDANDVAKIASIAGKWQPGTFHTAISTLTLMCNTTAEQALMTLLVQTKDPTYLQFIRETKQRTDSFKSKTSFCSRKTPRTRQKQEGP